MSKPIFQVLGLTLALVLASGCGRGFEANNLRPGSNKDGGSAPKPITKEEKAQNDVRLQNNEAKMRADVAQRNLTAPEGEKLYLVEDASEKASVMIRAASLEKIGGLLRVSAVVKANEAEDAPNLTVEINIELSNEKGKIQDGYVVASSSDKVTVAGAGEEENKALAEKFQALFICTMNCNQVSVRFQRVEAKDKSSIGDYAAMLEFDFKDSSNEATLATSSLKGDAALPSVKNFIIAETAKIQSDIESKSQPEELQEVKVTSERREESPTAAPVAVAEAATPAAGATETPAVGAESNVEVPVEAPVNNEVTAVETEVSVEQPVILTSGAQSHRYTALTTARRRKAKAEADAAAKLAADKAAGVATKNTAHSR